MGSLKCGKRRLDVKNFKNILPDEAILRFTEAEWEYAARGGNQSKGYQYAGSKDIGTVAWHAGNAGRKTQPVGKRKSNELGLYDMSGNVAEWCRDQFGIYPVENENNPTRPASGVSRVIRGGSFGANPPDCRPADCGGNAPTWHHNGLGFRLARPI